MQITLYSSALWTDERYLNQADAELNCDWEIYNVNDGPSMPEWIAVSAPYILLKKKIRSIN